MVNFLKFLGILILFFLGGFLFLAGIVYMNVEDSELLSTGFLVVGIPSFIFSIVLFYRFSRRCKKCKKWGVMEKLSDEIINDKENYVFDNYISENYKGEISKKFEQRKVREYILKRSKKCKKCGNIQVEFNEKKIIY